MDTVTNNADKVVLVTGATRGIGRAAAIAFAKRGYIVVANFKNRKDLAEPLGRELAAYNPRSFVYAADVSDEKQVNEMFRYVFSCFSSLDVLVNNAGVAEEVLVTDMSGEQFQRMLQNNLLPVFYATRAFLSHNIKAERGGAIVNVSSIYGMDGGSTESHYSAAKAGVIGFTKSVAKECALMNIRANAVVPGAVATDMTLKHSAETLSLLEDEIPMGRLGKPEEVADAIVFLAEASYITGETLRVSGGL